MGSLPDLRTPTPAMASRKEPCHCADPRTSVRSTSNLRQSQTSSAFLSIRRLKSKQSSSIRVTNLPPPIISGAWAMRSISGLKDHTHGLVKAYKLLRRLLMTGPCPLRIRSQSLMPLAKTTTKIAAAVATMTTAKMTPTRALLQRSRSSSETVKAASQISFSRSATRSLARTIPSRYKMIWLRPTSVRSHRILSRRRCLTRLPKLLSLPVCKH